MAWAQNGDVQRPVVVAVWNPFGRVGGAYQPDQYLEAKEAGLDWLTDGFVEAWKGLRDRQPGLQVMMYVGKPSADPELMRLIQQGELDAAVTRRNAMFAPLVEVSDLIGFDALRGSPPGGVDQWTTRWLMGQGVGVVGEWSPPVGHWAADLPSVVLYERIGRLHGPNQSRDAKVAGMPRWDEAAWPLYARPGRYVILKVPAIKGPRAMRAGVADVTGKGFGVLIQPTAAVMERPVDWYFEEAD
ncbi:MAG: hypothetical protein AAGL98_01465 [Planctomycetota bacterium]